MTIVNDIAAALTSRRETVAIAESCTGGFIANQLTNVAGASQWFERGAVCYSNDSKIQWLGVTPYIIDMHGAVSRECAEAMALGVRKISATTYGISVTGIAGPGGGSPEKPVGTVVIGIATPSGVSVTEHLFPMAREAFKEKVCETVLQLLKKEFK